MAVQQFIWNKASVSYEGNCVEVGKWRKASASNGNSFCVEVGAWNKASSSFSNGNCVEAGAWRKSSASAGNGECVESTLDENVVLVRDTKISRVAGDNAPVQAFSLRQWQKLVDSVKAGTFMADGKRTIKLGPGVKLELKQVGELTEWHLSGQPSVHSYTKGEMDAFVQGVLAGEFDLAPELALQLAAA
jgi:hypothetical protein